MSGMVISPAQKNVSAFYAPPLDGDGPLWLQIRRAIAHAILGGDWPAGTRIPPEVELTRHYDTSRMTVNKAILSLVSEGLLQRQTKQGTVVTSRARERPVFEFWDAADAVRQAGGRYSYLLVECTEIEPGSLLRAKLDVGNNEPVIRIVSLHFKDSVPFQLEDRLINAHAAPGITCQPLAEVGPGQWLLANVPWTSAKHSVTAKGAPTGIANLLRIEERSPCMVVGRRTWNGDESVTQAEFWYPEGQHFLEGLFVPSW